MEAGMRQIQPLSLPDTPRSVIDEVLPEFILVDPAILQVDEAYQRGLSERSLRLIRKIVANWRWSSFKPPVVARQGADLHVIDGQHTAIAAMTHGGIGKIPVMIVGATERADRAASFVAHNRDRITVTPTQLHAALVEAGDEDALTLAQVCDRAGVRVLRNPPQYGRFKSGETLAASTIRALISRRHPIGARRVLEICGKAEMAPVGAGFIKAVELLLFNAEYKGDVDPDKITSVIRFGREELEDEASRFAAERRVPHWRALASVIFMRTRRRGRG